MIQWLITAVFNIITHIASVFITPFITAVTILFPDLSTLFTHYSSYINQAFTYFHLIIETCLIPREAISILLSYYAIKFSIYLLQTAITFVLNVYNLLKP